MNRSIGIDLGTGVSVVSVMENGKVTVIPNSEGKNTTPSIWCKDPKTGEEKVGDAAKRQAVTNPENTIYEVKRLMGKSYNDIVKAGIDKSVSYKIVDNNGSAAVEVEGKIYTPEEISAKILSKMKETAEAYLGQPIESAVITCPAHFSDPERQAILNSAEIADLKVTRIINEPTAAALSYENDEKSDKTYMVFDYGSGTTDVSIISVDNESGIYEVISNDGNLQNGGSNIDEIIVDHLAGIFKHDHNFDLRLDKLSHQRLKESAEKAKIELSSSTSTEINLPYIFPINNIPQHLVTTISRSLFDQLVEPIINDTIEVCKRALKSSGLSIDEIDDILLVGGSSRIPLVQERIEKEFGKKPSKNLHFDEAISRGACIMCSNLNGESNDVLLLDVCSVPMGIQTDGNVFTTLIEANTTIPCKKTQTFSNAVDNQPNADIIVLQGFRPMASDNKKLGNFSVEIPPMQKGQAQIEVTFDVDANSILTVTALEKTTNKQQSITIKDSSSLSEDEIERMKAEAEANKEADTKRKEEVEKLNTADSLIFQTEKLIEENSDKISDDMKSTIEQSIAELKTAKDAKDLSMIDTIIEKLNTNMQAIYQEMQANQTTNESTEPSDNGTETEVEYEEVKD